MKNRIVFIIAVGRSGTKWLANILSKSDNTIVYHEPEETFHQDKDIYIRKFRGKPERNKTGHIADMGYKKKFIEKQIEGNKKTYIEVNGYLRRCLPELRKAFPHAEIYHLIRNGKDVVTSMMNKKSSVLNSIDRGQKFLTSCFIWNADNYLIKEYTKKHWSIRLEDLTTDFTWYVWLCVKIGIKPLIKKQWSKLSKKKVNETGRHIFKWDEESTRLFNNMNSNLMENYGYK